MKKWAGLLVFLGGCGVAQDFSARKIAGNETEVAVSAGAMSNPGEVAQAHCGQHNKTAVLRGTETNPSGLNRRTGVYYFDCK